VTPSLLISLASAEEEEEEEGLVEVAGLCSSFARRRHACIQSFVSSKWVRYSYAVFIRRAASISCGDSASCEVWLFRAAALYSDALRVGFDPGLAAGVGLLEMGFGLRAGLPGADIVPPSIKQKERLKE